VSRSTALAWLLACWSLPLATAGSLEVVTARRVRGAPMPNSLYFVGLDDLARRLDARLGWDAESGARSIEKGGKRAVVLPGVAFALVGSQGVPLREPVVWRYGRVYVPRSLVPRLEELFHTRPARPSPPRPSPRRGLPGKHRVIRCVCVDPGHGGKDPGAISRWGTREKDLVLAVGQMLADELRSRGLQAVMTRRSDVFIELNDRPVLADRLGADLFISIHANSCPDRSVRGVEIYYADERYDPRAIAAEVLASGDRGHSAAQEEALQGSWLSRPAAGQAAGSPRRDRLPEQLHRGAPAANPRPPQAHRAGNRRRRRGLPPGRREVNPTWPTPRLPSRFSIRAWEG